MRFKVTRRSFDGDNDGVLKRRFVVADHFYIAEAGTLVFCSPERRGIVAINGDRWEGVKVVDDAAA